MPVRPHRSYRHEAFLYDGDDDFLDGVLPFLRDAVDAGQPVVVAVRSRRAGPLRAALGPDADGVHFADVSESGGNPARIIPGLQRFLDAHRAEGRPVRGVGEPVRVGRPPAEIREAQLHEAMLNVAVGPDTPLWLRCLYDVGTLPAEAVEEAARSHPVLVRSGGYAGSRSYGGRQHVEDLLAAELPEPAQPVDVIGLPAGRTEVEALIGRHVAAAGLDPERAWALALAVRQTTAGAVPGWCLRMWTQPDALVCEVRDPEPLADPMAGRRDPEGSAADPRGLWLANQLCDLVQVRSTAAGTTIRILSWR